MVLPDVRDGRGRRAVPVRVDVVVAEPAGVFDAGQPIDLRVGRDREPGEARSDEPDQGVQPGPRDRDGGDAEHGAGEAADGDGDEHHSHFETQTDEGQSRDGEGDGRQGHHGSHDSEPGDA